MPEWAKLLGKYGLATILALYLVYFLRQDVRDSLERIESTVQNHSVDSQYALKESQELKAQLFKLNSTLVAVCVNQARNQTERFNCFNPPRQ